MIYGIDSKRTYSFIHYQQNAQDLEWTWSREWPSVELQSYRQTKHDGDIKRLQKFSTEQSLFTSIQRELAVADQNKHQYKALVDSRLRPQWCFHLANVTEMEEMLDCKLDALIRSFAWEKKRFSWQHKSARITWPLTLTLTLTLSTPWTQTYLETIVCKFGRDPLICVREVMVSANSVQVYGRPKPPKFNFF